MSQDPIIGPFPPSQVPVHVYTLGRFEIHVEGEKLPLSARGKPKPLEMLKVLIAMGGKAVSVEHLLESLWPDSDGDRAYSTFTTTLGRLRKQIGADSLSLQDGRISLEDTHCWSDASSLIDLFGQARQALSAGDAESAWSLTESALTLYRGPFLDGEFEPPELLSMREKLHGLFLRHLHALGEGYCEVQQPERAAEMLRRGLEVDDLAEEIYRDLMQCYLKMGRISEGLATYQRCREIFRTSVGIDPSPETEQLREALMKAQPETPAAAEPPVDAPSPTPVHDGPPQPVVASPRPVTADPVAKPVDLHPAQPPPGTGQGGERYGQRRTLTVSFTDLSGYGVLNETLDPEEVQEIMRRIKTEALSIIERHGGFVNQFAGDDVLALFGYPVAHEDDPVRAVRAAMELHEAVRAIRWESPDHETVTPAMHTGINTGLVVTTLGDDRDGRVGITGDAVNVASRLVSLANAGEVLISDSTFRQVEPYFEAEALEPVILRGRSQETVPYRIQRESGVKSRMEVSVRRGLTRLAAREQELATLTACLDKTREGEGQLVSVIGEPGLGKSRLVFEFMQTVDGKANRILEARALAQGRETPYLPFQDVLRKGLALRENLTLEQQVTRVIENVRNIDPDLERFMSFYLYMVSLSSPDFPLPEKLSSEELRQGLETAVGAMWIRSARRRPLVIVLEDVHWIDDASLSALRPLVGLIHTHPIMLIMTYRPEFDPKWGHLGHHNTISLRPLNRDQGQGMMQSIFEAELLDDGLVDRIWSHSGGNPYFIEELCRTLVEDGTLVPERGHVNITRDLAQVPLPDTVEAVIRTRIDRLEPDPQHTLRLASVIGREFSQDLLERIASNQVRVSEHLERLKELDLVQQTEVFPDPQYRFKHALVQMVAYETLLLRQRRTLHGLVAKTLLERHPEREEENLEALAFHYQASADGEKALEYLSRAGDKAAAMYSLEDARAHYHNALKRLDALESTPERQEAWIDLTLRWAAVSYYAATPQHLDALHRARDHAEALGRTRDMIRATLWIGRFNAVLGFTKHAIEFYERALELAREHEDEEYVTRAMNSIGRICTHTGEYHRGIEYLEKATPEMLELGDLDEWLFSMALQGRLYGTIGAFEQSFSLLEMAIEKSGAIGNLTQESACTAHLGWMKCRKGDWRDAIDCSERAIQLGRKIGNRLIAQEGMIVKGYSLFHQGNREQGLRWMETGLNLDDPLVPVGASTFIAWLSEVYALSGRPKDVTRAVKRLEQLRERSGSRSGDITSNRALGIVAGLADNPQRKTMESHMTQAIEFAVERGAQPDQGLSHFYYAWLLYRLKSKKKAGEHRDQALALFEQLGMDWWRACAEALPEYPSV